MERETLLSMLILLLGGLALHLFAFRIATPLSLSGAARRERLAWRRLWLPLVPVLIVAAWLCGWALSSPDPVPAHVGAVLFLGCGAFALLLVRAGARSVWALLAGGPQPGIATFGLFRPRVVLSKDFAMRLDEREVAAALEHERAHARHRDPLRIWLAQFVTDLQWPRAAARLRFRLWLSALEQARDDEARARGVQGVDLAAAVLASLRYGHCAERGRALLTGDGDALRERVERLLRPLSTEPYSSGVRGIALLSILLLILAGALALGITFGGGIVDALLRVTA
jgi:Zn-dependent protease with chaperone function